MHSFTSGRCCAILLWAALLPGCTDPLSDAQKNSVKLFEKLGGDYPQAFTVTCAESLQDLNSAVPLAAAQGAITAAYLDLDPGKIKYDVVKTKSLVTPHTGVIRADGSFQVKDSRIPAENAIYIAALAQVLGSIDHDRQRLTQRRNGSGGRRVARTVWTVSTARGFLARLRFGG
jgi:hypothetical protein